mmetsp:Transcript_60653/g.180418  ORF Transcript_60653/g.180418 Transcript_60653/m.180418 type:complete len:519 (-) Transcript_60653:992-2548(-)
MSVRNMLGGSAPQKLRLRSSLEEISSKPPMLKKSSRRPSVPINMSDLADTVTPVNSKPTRLQQLELSIVKQGWLTKLSRSGLPNWNKRWFILIGGSMYYTKTEAADPSSLSVFTELMQATRVELDQRDGSDNCFKLITEKEQYQFAAPSARARLDWMEALEGNLGMEPVALTILLRELGRKANPSAPVETPSPVHRLSAPADTSSSASAHAGVPAPARTSGPAPPLQIMSSLTYEVNSLEEKLQASETRVEELSALVAQLQTALVQKDEQLWSLAATMKRGARDRDRRSEMDDHGHSHAHTHTQGHSTKQVERDSRSGSADGTAEVHGSPQQQYLINGRWAHAARGGAPSDLAKLRSTLPRRHFARTRTHAGGRTLDASNHNPVRQRRRGQHDRAAQEGWFARVAQRRACAQRGGQGECQGGVQGWRARRAAATSVEPKGGARAVPRRQQAFRVGAARLHARGAHQVVQGRLHGQLEPTALRPDRQHPLLRQGQRGHRRGPQGLCPTDAGLRGAVGGR